MKMITKTKASQLLGISIKTMNRWLELDAMPYVVIDSTTWIREEVVMNFGLSKAGVSE